MSSELVKVERIKRKAAAEQALITLARETVVAGKDLLIACLKSDAPSLLLSLGAVEVARKNKLVGDLKASIVQGVMTAAFALHGFQGGVSS